MHRLAPNLRAIGIEVGRDRTGNRRIVTLSNVRKSPSQPSSLSSHEEASDSDDSDDSTSPPSDKSKRAHPVTAAESIFAPLGGEWTNGHDAPPLPEHRPGEDEPEPEYAA